MGLCYCDFDGGGDVDGADFAILIAHFGDLGCPDGCSGDADADFDVDLDDLSVFAKELGRANKLMPENI